MQDGFAFELTLVGVLILLNAFFSGAEMAVISARRGRLQALADAGHRGAQAALRLRADPDRFLATVQVGVTMVGTLASAVGGVAAIERLKPVFASLPIPWLARFAEQLAVVTVVCAIAYLSLVVGELMPKSLAVRHAETFALAIARPVEALSRISAKIVALLTASSRLGLRLLGHKEQAGSPFHTLEDLRALVEEAEEQGSIPRDVLAGAFAFHDRAVREVLTPRPRIVSLPLSATLQDARRIVARSGHTRFPVVDGTLDGVVGVLYARDLYGAEDADPTAPIHAMVRPASFIPQGKKAIQLLAEMRAARRQIAFVVDEHGSFMGLVTIEDLVEVIVGEIPDEHAAPMRLPATVGEDGVIEADGTMTIHELNEDLQLDLPESPHYVTLGGLLLTRLGELPVAGKSVEVPPYVLTASAMDGRRIARVRILTAATASR
jgi:putative hemolysin